MGEAGTVIAEYDNSDPLVNILLTQKLEKLQDLAGAREAVASYCPRKVSQELQELQGQLQHHTMVCQQICDCVCISCNNNGPHSVIPRVEEGCCFTSTFQMLLILAQNYKGKAF